MKITVDLPPDFIEMILCYEYNEKDLDSLPQIRTQAEIRGIVVDSIRAVTLGRVEFWGEGLPREGRDKLMAWAKRSTKRTRVK